MLRRLETASRRSFGGPRKPLLVSVRSGAPVSMPGMMDTLLNIGLCDATVHGLIRLTGNPRLAWDSYRRLVRRFRRGGAWRRRRAVPCRDRGGPARSEGEHRAGNWISASSRY